MCDLADLELTGHQFTWEKSRGTDRWIDIRLDRAMVNSKWLAKFRTTQLLNLEVTLSDHSPIFLCPILDQRQELTSRFRCENAWLTDPMCFELVRRNWSTNVQMPIQVRLEGCKKALNSWGKDLTGNFKRRIELCRKLLKKLTSKRDEFSIGQYKEIQKKLAEIYHQKEVYWRQRSKQLWLQLGDRNTKYFHTSTTIRRKNNLIVKLQDENDFWRTETMVCIS